MSALACPTLLRNTAARVPDESFLAGPEPSWFGRPRADVKRWSTDDFQGARKMEYYASVLGTTLTPMAVARVPSVERFSARGESMTCGPLDLIQIDSAPHTLQRGDRELEKSMDRHFRLVWSTKTTLDIVQRQPLRLRPNEMAFLDTGYPHTADIISDSRVRHIRIPYAWLRQWVPDPQVLVGRSIPGYSGWGRALTAYASQLVPSFFACSPLPAAVLADQLGALLALACAELQGQPPESATAPMVALSDRIQTAIADRCSDPDLTPAAIAEPLNISVRTLHRSLAARQTSFGELLIASRAQIAMRMLRNPTLARLTTSEIGRRAGFVDPSHFVRVMRRLAGKTPLQLRNAGLEGSPTQH